MNDFVNRLKKFCDSIDAPKETKLQYKVKEAPSETYGIWKLTLPYSKPIQIGWGFPTKEDAYQFLAEHTKTKTRMMKDSDTQTVYYYDVYPELTGPINVYQNSAIFTTVGNDREEIYKKWREGLHEADN